MKAETRTAAARIRDLVAAGLTPEQAAREVGVPPSRARAAVKRRPPGRPTRDTVELRARVPSELPDAVRALADQQCRGIGEVITDALRAYLASFL